jgi:hypothetical protein
MCAMEVLLVKEGQKLGAADSLSAEALDSIKKGETVTASIRRPRNIKHHRKLWALLTVVFEAQSQFATTQDLLGALKIATGLFETGQTVDKMPYIVPKSISFASMAQTEFEQWYERALEIILTRILPGINRDELTDRVNDIINGNQH